MTVLKLACYDPMTRDSVVALSYLHEGFELSSLASPEREKVCHCRRQALSHYISAANQMHRQLSNLASSSPTLLLAASICLTCLELLQDNYLAAISHFKGGLQVIRAYCMDRRSEPISFDSTPTQAPEDSVTRPFNQLLASTLYLQIIGFHISLIPKIRLRDLPLAFDSVLEAKEYLDDLSISAYCFFWENKNPSILFSTVEILHQKEIEALSEWRRSFSELLFNLDPHPDSKDLLGIELLKIQHHCLQAMLDIAYSNHGATIETSGRTFQRILDIVQGLLEPPKTCLLSRYAFDAGVTGPLFYTAIRAPSLPLRQRAISLLRHPNIPFREGLFSSSMCAAMAEGIITLQVDIVTGEKTHGLCGSQSLLGDDALEKGIALDTTWFHLNDLQDELKTLKVSVGRKDFGPMPHALKESVVSWSSW